MQLRHLSCTRFAAALAVALPAAALAHGFVGDRFFPATLTSDDPLATDELAFPAFSYFQAPGDGHGPGLNTSTLGFEFDKVILPRLSLGISENFLAQSARHSPSAHGLDNLSLSIKYELWQNAPHQAILSIGLETDLGGTGSKAIGRESYSTFTPTLYFGKGFGDLPDSLWPIKPLALTGTLGLSFPTEANDPNTIQWALALEYNIPYLQQHIKDLGIPEPFKSVIPLVEFTNESPFNRRGGVTTGTVNPGLLYESHFFQVGAEALIPINRESGAHVGGIVVLEIYIDDLFPKLFGHPIFGGN
jgi:hypothetical protein